MGGFALLLWAAAIMSLVAYGIQQYTSDDGDVSNVSIGREGGRGYPSEDEEVEGGGDTLQKMRRWRGGGDTFQKMRRWRGEGIPFRR